MATITIDKLINDYRALARETAANHADLVTMEQEIVERLRTEPGPEGLKGWANVASAFGDTGSPSTMIARFSRRSARVAEWVTRSAALIDALDTGAVEPWDLELVWGRRPLDTDNR